MQDPAHVPYRPPRRPDEEMARRADAFFREMDTRRSVRSPSKNYYVKESVGIACGMFVAALHYMGLATLTLTPSPMGFLRELLGRPKNERPYILFPVGHPAPDATVPDLARKTLDEVALWNPPRDRRLSTPPRRSA